MMERESQQCEKRCCQTNFTQKVLKKRYNKSVLKRTSRTKEVTVRFIGEHRNYFESNYKSPSSLQKTSVFGRRYLACRLLFLVVSLFLNIFVVQSSDVVIQGEAPHNQRNIHKTKYSNVERVVLREYSRENRRRSNSFSSSSILVEEQYYHTSLKVCSVLGGLDITRIRSSETRNFFKDAIEDVELIREYLNEAFINGGINGGLSDFDEMSQTLDAEARDLPPLTSTVDAKLAWVDDRPNRRMERYVSKANQPLVGTKASDMAIIDSVSNIFPWIVDRKSKEKKWWLNHRNGRSEGEKKIPFQFDSLYQAAWMGTFGEAWMYYPPLSQLGGHPLTFADILGESYNSHGEEFVKPNLPEYNTKREAFFTEPYPDTAVPGLSLITAMAPVYLTGKFQNYSYNDSYLASTGVDIAVSAVSALFDELEDALTLGSFAFLIDSNFNVIVISQSVVNKIYPERTGFEESRVVTNLVDGSVISDRRDKNYTVSDTILQSLDNLTNADWSSLKSDVQSLAPGERDFKILNVTLTGKIDPTEFYVMYDRWEYVADWVLLVFAPVSNVENAMNVTTTSPNIELDVAHGMNVESEIVLTNTGSLNALVSINKLPFWIDIKSLPPMVPDIGKKRWSMKSGDNVTIQFSAATDNLKAGSSSSSVITFNIEDDHYLDCFHNKDISVKVQVNILVEEELNQIKGIRFIGLTLSALVSSCSVGFALWTYFHQSVGIVRASQPVFLIRICLGTLLMGLAIVPMSIDDGVASQFGCDVACVAAPWLFTIGFSTIFSALFSKIWRVNKLFNSKTRFRRRKVTEMDVSLPMIILLSLNVMFLLLWTLFDPLHWVRIHQADGTSSYGSCVSEGKSSIAFVVIIAVINLCALVLANIQAYLAREICDEFSESKYIGIAMASMLQMCIVGVPLLFLVVESPPANFFVRSGIIFVICMALLLLIFLPKLLHLRKFHRNGEEHQRRPSFGCDSTTSSDRFIIDSIINKKRKISAPEKSVVLASTSPKHDCCGSANQHFSTPVKCAEKEAPGSVFTESDDCEGPSSIRIQPEKLWFDFLQYKDNVAEVALKLKQRGVENVDEIFESCGITFVDDYDHDYDDDLDQEEEEEFELSKDDKVDKTTVSHESSG